jgi:uncharacterized membrane protein YphA (DoxX/SURF4 family)
VVLHDVGIVQLSLDRSGQMAMTMWLLVQIARLAVSIVLLAAGATKGRSRREFAQSLQTLGVINERLRPGIVLFLPWLEVSLGVACRNFGQVARTYS